MEVYSGLALINHLKHLHKDVKSYKCELCVSAFNNLQALSSHMSVVYRKKLVKCKMCHTKLPRVHMRQHVHKHSKGFQCSCCHHAFPMKSQFTEHLKCHKTRQCFDCEECDAFFYSTKSLHLHQKGKHGDGYFCAQCNAHFNTPSQRSRHVKKIH